MRGARLARMGRMQWREDWSAVQQIMHGAETFACLRLIGRIIDHPVPSLPGLVRTRVLIEDLYAERSATAGGAPWDDPHTRTLLTAAIRHLPEHERALAEGERAVVMFHGRHQSLGRLGRV